jgi:hypothetical protein
MEMPVPVLTEDIAIQALRNFFRAKPFLFFGTGMSCALDSRFGMPALKDALVSGIENRALIGPQKTEWDAVASALRHGTDLENALNSVGDPDLLKVVTEVTGSFVASIDQEFAYRIAQGSAEWPATKLLKKLVDTLPEGDRILHVLTPNYDMLCEYACDYTGIPYGNGFFGCVERKADWNAVDCSLRTLERVTYGRKSQIICKHRKHIRIYKVHGSLNYFFHRNAVVENNAWMWNPPNFAPRVMITPGLSKYQTLQLYRQELLQSADTAINNATHFLFLGYGFNDNHLEEYIKRKLITQACHGLIVTRDSNPRIKSLLDQSDNLWLVCKSEDEPTESTSIFNKQYADSLVLSGQRLWDIGEFTKRILGG